MKSTEDMALRLEFVDMHNYFINRIDAAMQNNSYIEANWLIYACFENRYFRILKKYREDCKYCRSDSNCNRSENNRLALSTKVNCVLRLLQANVSCVSDSFNEKLLKDTLIWIKERNKLMHQLLKLDTYEKIDELFKKSAEEGQQLLQDTYDCCTEFRRRFYTEGYEFVMPESVMDECACNPKKKRRANDHVSPNLR